MKTNHQLIEHFYKAFQQRDYEAMNACYHPDIHFFDPVFSDLRGDQAKAMWHGRIPEFTVGKIETRS